ncbi:MAG: hypothetical protein ACRDKJ_12060, partial [Actinomycetota bacterium]
MDGAPREALGRLTRAAATGELDEVCLSHAVRLLVAFGSATRNNEDSRDLDIAVGFEPVTQGNVLTLLDDLVV